MARKWTEFEAEVLESARLIRTAQSVKYAESTPAVLFNELSRIDKGVTKLLRVLQPLDLCHRTNQDLEVEPFNWPLIQSLQAFGPWPPARSALANDPAYPTALIESLVELRDRASRAMQAEKPPRGNSSRRSERTHRIDMVSKNFVRLYRGQFNKMPPISKSGREVDLIQRALEVAGVEDADAAEVLRSGVKRARSALT
jgi:hypothetical protein